MLAVALEVTIFQKYTGRKCIRFSQVQLDAAYLLHVLYNYFPYVSNPISAPPVSSQYPWLNLLTSEEQPCKSFQLPWPGARHGLRERLCG